MTQEKHDVKTAKPLERKLNDDRKRIQPPSKVVMRRLPPSLTPEQFLEQVAPLPNYDFFYFVKADISLGQWAFTRAYINFQQPEDIYNFRDKFDGYIFLDSKGNEYPAIVEFSPFQKVPKKKAKKPDAKKGTIEQDSDYVKFVESLTNPDDEPVSSIETYLEELEQKEKESKGKCQNVSTPLIEYLLKRREEKKQAILKIKEDRKRRELERRRFKEEEKRKKKEKDKLREKDRFREKDRDKDREKDKEKDWDEKKDDQHTVKLLKNPDREKEKDGVKEKDQIKAKEDSDKSLGREKLRFSKENREKEKLSRNGRTGISEKARSSDMKSSRDTPERGGGDHGKVDIRREERVKLTREDRVPDRSRSYHDDRPRSVRDTKDRDWPDRDVRDKYRDDRPRPGGYKNSDSRRRHDDREEPTRQAGRYSEERRKYEDRKEQVRKDDGRGDREKTKMESKMVEKDKSHRKEESKEVKKDDQSHKSKGENLSDPVVKGNSQSDSKGDSSKEGSSERDSDKLEKVDGDDRRRRRKDRPERQIYVPRKALERQKQEAAKQVETSKGEGQSPDNIQSCEKGQSSDKIDISDKGEEEVGRSTEGKVGSTDKDQVDVTQC